MQTKPAEDMTEAELTAEISRLQTRMDALKTLRQMKIAIQQTRDRARRMLTRYQTQADAALEAVRATNPGQGRAAA